MGLDILKIPIVVIDKNLNTIFVNNEAKKLNGRDKGQKCYEVLFGFDRPCWEIPGYKCPLKELLMEHKELAFTINNYPIKDRFKRFLVEIFRLNKQTFVEFLIPFESIELFEEEKNPFHVDKARLIHLMGKLLNEGKDFIISSINIKKLKAVNQFFGIEVGDAIIHAIERILDKYSQKYKFYFAEVAGGYFAVVNDAIKNSPFFIEEEIFKDLENIQRIFHLPVKPRISIVTAEIKPILTKDPNDVFKIIFYAEKFKKDEGTLYLDPPKLNEILTNLGLKKKLVATLEDILKNHDVEVFFQPIVNLKSGDVEHFETLIRLKQNENYLPVGDYIDLIYELNLIVDFDLQVLDKLNEYLPTLKRLGRTPYINVSSVDLKNDLYRNKLLETINRFRENGLDLGLEITEQVLLEELDFIKFLNDSLGLKFAIDDFGTGYSSLKMVIDLISNGILDAIKLDCSLVRSYFSNKEAKVLVNSVVAFTNSFGIKTVAECVETKEQAEELKKIGVSHGQGYYFYKPLPLEELVKKLSN